MFKKMLTFTAIALMAGTTVQAQDYPSKPVTLLIPYAAGGSTETMIRVFSKSLEEQLG